jgi:16S rRNA processing protein RimM
VRLPDDAIQVAKVGRPHGVEGEVRMQPTSDDPARLVALPCVWLTGPDGHGAPADPDAAPRRFEVESVRVHGDVALVRLRGQATRDDAASLVHAEVWARRADLPALEADEFAVTEVVGLELIDSEEPVGRIEGVTSIAGRDYFEVAHAGATVLVPAVKDWLVDFDPAGGRIVMRLPAGLLEPAR